jgi:deoxycytidylate deaminase
MSGDNTAKTATKYPYMPKNGEIVYVSADNPFMLAAKAYAGEHSLDSTMPTGSVIVRDGEIIGRGANGSDYHKTHECQRVKQHIPTGQGYELCEGCHPKNHSEPRAVADALQNFPENADLSDAELYLWGHWWCCQPCWDSMINSGIKRVYLQENSQILFNKESPDNIVGHQFDNKPLVNPSQEV